MSTDTFTGVDTLGVTDGGSATSRGSDATLGVTSGGFISDASTPTTATFTSATAAEVRSALGITGSAYTGKNIKIGVLSTSFNNSGGAAQDEADGALPPASSITVVKDAASDDDRNDAGIARNCELPCLEQQSGRHHRHRSASSRDD